MGVKDEDDMIHLSDGDHFLRSDLCDVHGLVIEYGTACPDNPLWVPFRDETVGGARVRAADDILADGDCAEGTFHQFEEGGFADVGVADDCDSGQGARRRRLAQGSG